MEDKETELETRHCNNCKESQTFARLNDLKAWECNECSFIGYFDNITLLVEYWKGWWADPCYDWYYDMRDVPGLTDEQKTEVQIRQLQFEMKYWHDKATSAEKKVTRYKTAISVLREVFNKREEF